MKLLVDENLSEHGAELGKVSFRVGSGPVVSAADGVDEEGTMVKLGFVVSFRDG